MTDYTGTGRKDENHPKYKANLIALIGPKGSGKTTLSKHLQAAHGYIPTSFATPIKLMLQTLLEYQNLDKELIQHMLYGNLKEEETEYLAYRSPRFAMQTLGSEWRDLISRSLWTNIWENKTYSELRRGKKFVVDDMRFLHEEESVRDLSGKVILIHRPGHVPSNEHISELEYLKIAPDLIINNDSNLPHMFNQINDYLGANL